MRGLRGFLLCLGVSLIAAGYVGDVTWWQVIAGALTLGVYEGLGELVD